MYVVKKGNLYIEGEEKSSSFCERRRVKWFLFIIVKREVIMDYMGYNCVFIMGWLLCFLGVVNELGNWVVDMCY